MNLKELASAIPDYQRYYTVDELNAATRQLAQQFPRQVKTQVLGETKQGMPIELISVGDGPRHAFVFGAPDPDEPVGCLMIEFLSRRLCADRSLRQELGYTWHFIKAIEADGMRRNEGWISGPYHVSHYARHLYRGWVSDKADFAFPASYKRFQFDQVLPETKLLMSVIDQYRPHFMYALHNGKFGGVWYSLTQPCPSLYPLLQEIPEWFGLALNRGETEGGRDNQVASAIYCNPRTFAQWYDALEAKGLDPLAMRSWGASSREYALRYQTFSLITEVPMWNAPQSNDDRPSPVLYRDAVLAGLDSMAQSLNWARGMMQSVQEALRLDSPVRHFVEEMIRRGQAQQKRQRQGVQSSPDAGLAATYAELFSHGAGMVSRQMALSGMIARIMDDEIQQGNKAPRLREIREAAWGMLQEKGDLLESMDTYRTVPIRDLVGVQLCAGLAAAAYVQDHVP